MRLSKSLAEFFRRSEKINSIVFCGGVYVAKNTYRAYTESKPSASGFDSGRSCNEMDEKWRLPLWAAAAAKDMEFAATWRSAISFVKEGYAFFDKLKA